MDDFQRVLALVFALVATSACGGGASAAQSAQPGVVGGARCTSAGTWQLEIHNASGCPLPARATLVDGEGTGDGRWSMDFSMQVGESDAGECTATLTGAAGRLFHVEASVALHGDTASGRGQAMSGETRYSCGGAFIVLGERVN